MTFTDAITNNPTFNDVPANIVELAFINRGIESTDDYNVDRLKELELVTADLYLHIASMPEIREGELSLKWDAAVLKKRARNIYLKYGDDRLSETGYNKVDLKITKE